VPSYNVGAVLRLSASEDLMMRVANILRLVTVVALFLSAYAVQAAAESFLTKKGQAQATIVVGQRATAFDRWVAGELQRYLKRLSGADLPVVTNDKLPADKSPLIVVGSPATNTLLAAAQAKGQVDFKGLKPEGLIIKTLDLDGHPAVLVGGNDEAGTMYAAYDFLERLGIVFQLTGDIIPEQKADLALPAFDVRTEPAMKIRGMHCCHALRWYMGMDDFRRHLDQLAKLKINCLQFYFGIGGSPWLEFSYKGKKAELRYPKESGYLAWGGENMFNTSGTAKDVRVGRECFPQEYLGAPEFANVQTPDEAFATARQFLREIIRYAHQRKIQVWIMMGEIPRVPANLVPVDTKNLSDLSFITWLSYCGRRLPNAHPDLVPIYEAAFESLIRNYPEADGYGTWTSEGSAEVDDPETQQMIAENNAARKLVPTAEEIAKLGNSYVKFRARKPGQDKSVLDSDFAEICVANKIVRAVKAKHPQIKLVAGVVFRGYLLRAMDALMPKDVWLMNMDTYMNSKPVMDCYGGMEGRNLLVMPRIDHDGCELHMQLNITQYEEDEILAGAAKHHLAGIVGQLNKERGLELNTRYLAEGEWNPQLEARSFYRDYLTRVFGKEAAGTLAEAYLLLDKSLGYRVIQNGVLFCGWTRFRLYPLDPSKAHPTQQWTSNPQAASRQAQSQARIWTARAEKDRQALAMLRQALPEVLPGSRSELQYVIYKVENFGTHMDVAVALNEAKAALALAEVAKKSGDMAERGKQLSQCKAALDRADGLARQAAQQMVPYCNIPTEKYLLFRYNQNVIGSIEEDQEYLRQVIAQNQSSSNN
jgi:hypothetical protein